MATGTFYSIIFDLNCVSVERWSDHWLLVLIKFLLKLIYNPFSATSPFDQVRTECHCKSGILCCSMCIIYDSMLFSPRDHDDHLHLKPEHKSDSVNDCTPTAFYLEQCINIAAVNYNQTQLSQLRLNMQPTNPVVLAIINSITLAITSTLVSVQWLHTRERTKRETGQDGQPAGTCRLLHSNNLDKITFILQ